MDLQLVASYFTVKSTDFFCRVTTYLFTIYLVKFQNFSTLKEIIRLSQTGLYLVSLSSKTYVFEDKLTKYKRMFLKTK